MMRSNSMVVLGALVLCAGVSVAEETASGPETRGCHELVLAGELEAALEACHEELARAPDSMSLARLTARAEYAAGDALRAAELWRRVLTAEGWSEEAARHCARALWRGGETEAAEALFEEILDRASSLDAHSDLIAFLLSFDRWDEAASAAEKAAAEFPDHCEFVEDRGLAEAGRGRDEPAAKLFAAAVAGGCPAFRWTSRGVMPERVTQPAYRPLLQPELLVADLEKLSDRECLQRFELLRMVVTPAVAPEVAAQVLGRSTAQVRFAGLGLLADLGGKAVGSWEEILGSDDFILRKHALRRIRQLHDPVFEPVLFRHLEREELAGNRSLTLLALGELLLDGDQSNRGEILLRSIPKDDAVFPVALLSLADRAEARGEYAAALALVDEVKAAAPDFRVDPERVDRLRALAAEDER
jgi:tetratricopeptide (TPR) repeat protein